MTSRRPDASEQPDPLAPIPYRTFPCNECPWKVETLPGQFPAERYEALRSTTGSPGAEACLTAPVFACHKGQPGDPDTDVACAGWLAAVGYEHLGMRYALVLGRLPAQALEPGENWPALHPDYETMADAQAG